MRLYEKGLIYRGERIINWCPHCRTSISDAEVEFEEKDAAFYHLRYPFADGSGWLELATTRPETMLGDTAVAVHPDDERYRALVGKKSDSSPGGTGDPRGGRHLCGAGFRHRRGEDHPRPRSQRL